ncbi:hypothetical protein NIES39_O06260 [Arthrospira platensis NIES-39]|nr:hypothetical protein NIES39_O06260 [Arthrospira platensis NIES-39]
MVITAIVDAYFTPDRQYAIAPFSIFIFPKLPESLPGSTTQYKITLGGNYCRVIFSNLPQWQLTRNDYD